MITVRKPVLLDEHLQETEVLYPSKGSLKLEMNSAAEMSMTFRSTGSSIPMHAWVKIYNQLGFVGIFRRTSGSDNVRVEQSCTLRHGIDILQDSVYNGKVNFSGTYAEFITSILNQQTSLIQGPGDSAPRKPWVLGTCANTSTYTKSIKYDNLLELLTGMIDEGDDYYFTFDQTVWPWTVSLVAESNSVQTEFRLNRNIDKCAIKDNDSDLCTRLILNVNGMAEDSTLSGLSGDGSTINQNQSVFRIYDNPTAQAAYGIIVKTADIDVTRDTFPNGPFPEADAYAADFLARRAAPQVQIQIDGYELKRKTGEDWDETRMGTVCRVSLADYPAPIEERIVSVSYPDMYNEPDKVVLSLANALPTFTKSMASTQAAVSQQAETSRSTARSVNNLNMHAEIIDNAGNILKQAGIQLDANGVLIYATNNTNMIGSKFEVQANKIGMVVGEYQGSNYIKAAEIAVAINDAGEGIAMINAAHVNISGTNTVHALAGEIEVDDHGHLTIKSGGGMRVRKTIGGVTSEFGVYDENNLTSGVIISTINGETSATIKADYIDIQGVVNELSAYEVDVGSLIVEGQSTFYETIYATETDIQVDTVTADNVSSTNGYTCGNHTATWQSANLYSYTLGTYRYFLYGSSASSTSATGAQGAYPITGSNSNTIYYLGHT